MSRLREHFSAYSAVATAHGFFYVGSPRIPRPIRLIWAFVTVTALGTAGIIVFRTLQEWEDNPMSTDVDIFAFDPNVRL